MSYDASNKVTSIASGSKGSEQITYDAVGRPVSYKVASGQHTRQLSYGYLDKVLQSDGATGKAGFFYNAEGQLVGKLIAGKLTPYTWDNYVMAAEGTDAFTNENHVTGGVPVIESGQVVISDYLGTSLQRGSYEFNGTAFGQGQETGRFTGKVFIEELRSFLFQFRLYSPEFARWSAPDPCGFPDGNNNLLYVNCDPLTSIDPLGLVTHTMENPDTTVYTPTTSSYGEYNPFFYIIKKTDPTIYNAADTCFTPYVVGGGWTFETKGQYGIPNQGPMQASTNPVVNYTIDSITIDMLKEHESWHHTHHKTLADKTYGSLESWSSSYSGNMFSTSTKSRVKGNEDMNNARSLAYQEFNTNWTRTVNHESGGNYQFGPNSNLFVRTPNSAWGGTLNTSLSNITMNFQKNVGDCEH